MIQSPRRRASARSARRSSRLAVQPVGLLGELTKIAGARRDRGGEPVEIERPAVVAEVDRHFDRLAPPMPEAAAKFGHAGVGTTSRSRSRRSGDRDLDRLHAAAGHEESLGREVTAELAGVITRERRAQFRDAALIGVEGLAGGKRAFVASAMNCGVGRSPSPAQSGIRPGRPRP